MQYSIIIPTLNEKKLLPRLLKQLTENNIRKNYQYEIIISDGGSDDGTIQIAKNYADIVIEHKIKSYQNIAKGRNEGARAAKGNILIFINGDVELENTKKFFDTIKNKFINNDYLAMTCSVLVSPEERKPVDIIFLNFYNYYFHFLNIIGMGMGRGECQIIKKDVFDKIGGYNESLAAGEDFELFKRVRRLGKILFEQKMFIYESPRRYRKYGHFKIFFSWLFNSIFVIFKNKSLHKNWEQIR